MYYIDSVQVLENDTYKQLDVPYEYLTRSSAPFVTRDSMVGYALFLLNMIDGAYSVQFYLNNGNFLSVNNKGHYLMEHRSILRPLFLESIKQKCEHLDYQKVIDYINKL